MHRRILVPATLLLAVVSCSSCDDAPVEDSDFSGLVRDDLAGLDGATSRIDASLLAPDLAGYDLTCDPTSPLVGTGSPTGTWSLAVACATPDAWFPLVAGCAELAFTSNAVTSTNSSSAPASGPLGLFATGAFSRTVHGRLLATAVVPSACVQAHGGTCADYATSQSNQFDWLTISCANMTSGCTCSLAFDVSKEVTGTWSHTATTIAATVAGITTSYPFAVVGDTLRLRGDTNATRGDRGITWLLIR